MNATEIQLKDNILHCPKCNAKLSFREHEWGALDIGCLPDFCEHVEYMAITQYDDGAIYFISENLQHILKNKQIEIHHDASYSDQRIAPYYLYNKETNSEFSIYEMPDILGCNDYSHYEMWEEVTENSGVPFGIFMTIKN